MAFAYKKRQRNLFDPKSEKPFPLSRSRLETFINCPCCFYLDRRLGIEPPGCPPYNLNKAVDLLLKKEFDEYRAKGKAHPLMKRFGVKAVPYAHEDLDRWRNNFKGIRFLHRPTAFEFFGAVDDVWIGPREELLVVDYKSTSQAGAVTLEDGWKKAYKRQMEIYQWLFQKNGFNVSRTGYFVYCNADLGRKEFAGRLDFETVVLPYEGDTAWVETALEEAHRCLLRDSPPEPAPACPHCLFRRFCGEII